MSIWTLHTGSPLSRQRLLHCGSLCRVTLKRISASVMKVIPRPPFVSNNNCSRATRTAALLGLKRRTRLRIFTPRPTIPAFLRVWLTFLRWRRRSRFSKDVSHTLLFCVWHGDVIRELGRRARRKKSSVHCASAEDDLKLRMLRGGRTVGVFKYLMFEVTLRYLILF